jgi:hypothetical protein
MSGKVLEELERLFSSGETRPTRDRCEEIAHLHGVENVQRVVTWFANRRARSMADRRKKESLEALAQPIGTKTADEDDLVHTSPTLFQRDLNKALEAAYAAIDTRTLSSDDILAKLLQIVTTTIYPRISTALLVGARMSSFSNPGIHGMYVMREHQVLCIAGEAILALRSVKTAPSLDEFVMNHPSGVPFEAVLADGEKIVMRNSLDGPLLLVWRRLFMQAHHAKTVPELFLSELMHQASRYDPLGLLFASPNVVTPPTMLSVSTSSSSLTVSTPTASTPTSSTPTHADGVSLNTPTAPSSASTFITEYDGKEYRYLQDLYHGILFTEFRWESTERNFRRLQTDAQKLQALQELRERSCWDVLFSVLPLDDAVRECKLRFDSQLGLQSESMTVARLAGRCVVVANEEHMQWAMKEAAKRLPLIVRGMAQYVYKELSRANVLSVTNAAEGVRDETVDEALMAEAYSKRLILENKMVRRAPDVLEFDARCMRAWEAVVDGCLRRMRSLDSEARQLRERLQRALMDSPQARTVLSSAPILQRVWNARDEEDLFAAAMGATVVYLVRIAQSAVFQALSTS